MLIEWVLARTKEGFLPAYCIFRNARNQVMLP